MADSNRTGQRLLDSIRKAKAGDDAVGEAIASEAESPATPAPSAVPPARKTTARKATAAKAPVKKPAQRKARPGHTTRSQRGARPDAPLEDDHYQSRGRVWPD